MKTKYRFIEFIDKGGYWQCRNRRHADLLGVVEMYSPWRQYVFEPIGGSVFSVDCMQDIIHFIEQIKEAPNANPNT